MLFTNTPNSNVSTFVLCFLLLLGLGSCTKEEFLPDDDKYSVSSQHNHISSISTQVVDESIKNLIINKLEVKEKGDNQDDEVVLQRAT